MTRHRAGIVSDAVDFAATGKPAGDARDGPRHGRGTAMRRGQRDRRCAVAQQRRRLGAAEAEHRLVRVTGEQRHVGARGQHPNQQGGLRVELLGVVDEQHADPGPLAGQQLGVDGESLQSGADQFGGPDCRRRRLRGRRSHRGAQQHHLLVAARESARGSPFRAARQPAYPLQLLRVDAALGAPGQQLTQLGGETAVPSAARNSAGHASAPSAISPASNSAMIASCSALVTSLGGGPPARWAASRSTANA